MTCDSGQGVKSHRCLGLVRLVPRRAAAVNIRGSESVSWMRRMVFIRRIGHETLMQTHALTEYSYGMISWAVCHTECVGGRAGLNKGFGTP